MDKIDTFNGDHQFLSNFWAVQVEYDGLKYGSVEHAYQAAKTLDVQERIQIRNLTTAADAKKAGRKVELRKDWENIKLDVMLNLLREKFNDPVLRKLLIGTGDAELIEGNWWGDVYWGVCRGKGKNHLGKLLMRVREEVK